MRVDTKPLTFGISQTADFCLLSEIVRHSPSAIFLFDAHGNIALMNQKASELSGPSRDHRNDWKFSDLFDVHKADGSPMTLDDLASIETSSTIGRLRRLDDDEVYVVIKPSRIRNSAGDSYLLCFAKPSERLNAERRSHILSHFSVELAAIKTSTELFEKVARMLVENTTAENATIALIDDDEQNFIVQAEHPRRSHKSLVSARIHISGQPTQESIVERHEAVVAPNVASHSILEESDRVRSFVKERGIQSLLIVPMVFTDRLYGSISIASISHRWNFSAAEVDMYRTIAKQTASAIANSRSFESALSLQRHYSDVYSAASLQGVADKIRDRLLALVGCRKASIQLIVNGRRVLLSAHGFDRHKASPRLLGRIEHDPIVKTVIDSPEIKIIADTRKYPGWSHEPQTFDVNSWMAIPIIWKGSAVALITLDHDVPGVYGELSDTTRNNLQQLAQDAAVDIHEAFLFDSAQHQIKSFELVNHIAAVVNTQLDKTDLLGAVAREICDWFSCDQCKMFLLNSTGSDALELHAAWPLPRDYEASTIQLDDSANVRSPIVQAYRTGNTVVIGDFEDPQTAADYDKGDEIPANTQSMIAVPIKISDQVIGVLAASDTKINAYNQNDALLLKAITQHMGSAIERDSALEIVQSVGRDILRTTTMNDILKQIVSGAIQLTHTSTGVIYLIGPDGQINKQFKPEDSHHPPPRLDREDGITRTVIREKRMFEIDIDTDQRVNPDLRGKYRSMVAIPLLLDGDVIGVLYLNGSRKRKLTAVEKWIVLTLANQAAIAIQRTKLHEQICDRDAIYQSLVDNIPHYVFRKDINSRFTYANKSFCESLNVSPEEIKGRDDESFYAPDLAKSYVRADQEVIRTGKTIREEEQHQGPGMPKPIWVKIVKTPITDSDNKIVGVQAIFWDFTRERELRVLQEQYQVLVEQSPDSIILHERGNILMANSAALDLLGAGSIDEILGKSILSFIHPEDRERAKHRLEMLERNEIVDQAIEMRIIGQDGESIAVAVYARRLPDQSKIQVVIHDLTRHNNLLKDMNHRVQKAFTHVIGHIRRHTCQFPVHEDARNTLSEIERSMHAMSIVQSMVNGQYSPSEIDMQEYFNRLVKAVFDSHCQSSGQITRSVQADGVYLDEKRATHCGLIVAELVSNSLLYGFNDGRRGTVEVRLVKDGNSHTLSVADDGTGISDAKLQGGMSMGLTLVKQTAELDLKGQFIPDHTNGVKYTILFPWPKIV